MVVRPRFQSKPRFITSSDPCKRPVCKYDHLVSKVRNLRGNRPKGFFQSPQNSMVGAEKLPWQRLEIEVEGNNECTVRLKINLWFSGDCAKHPLCIASFILSSSEWRRFSYYHHSSRGENQKIQRFNNLPKSTQYGGKTQASVGSEPQIYNVIPASKDLLFC